MHISNAGKNMKHQVLEGNTIGAWKCRTQNQQEKEGGGISLVFP